MKAVNIPIIQQDPAGTAAALVLHFQSTLPTAGPRLGRHRMPAAIQKGTRGGRMLTCWRVREGIKLQVMPDVGPLPLNLGQALNYMKSSETYCMHVGHAHIHMDEWV